MLSNVDTQNSWVSEMREHARVGRDPETYYLQRLCVFCVCAFLHWCTALLLTVRFLSYIKSNGGKQIGMIALLTKAMPTSLDLIQLAKKKKKEIRAVLKGALPLPLTLARVKILLVFRQIWVVISHLYVFQ